MGMHSVQALPPKMAEQFTQRALNGEGVRLSDTSDIWEFPQGNTVVVVMTGIRDGHIVRDPHRAERLRRILAGASHV